MMLAGNWNDQHTREVILKSSLIDLDPQARGQQGASKETVQPERLSEKTLSISDGFKRCDSRLTSKSSRTIRPKTDKKFYIICALAVGDGCIWQTKGKEKAVLDIAHHFKYKDYVDYKKSILDMVGINSSVRVKNRRGNVQYRVLTRPNYLTYCVWEALYKDKSKIFTKGMSRNFGEWALAILWMDDGSLYWKRNTTSYSREGSISTHSFGKDGTEKIAAWLFSRFGIVARITKDNRQNEGYKYFLRLKQDSVDEVVKIVSPFVNAIPSMRYKVNRPNPNVNIWKQRV